MNLPTEVCRTLLSEHGRHIFTSWCLPAATLCMLRPQHLAPGHGSRESHCLLWVLCSCWPSTGRTLTSWPLASGAPIASQRDLLGHRLPGLPLPPSLYRNKGERMKAAVRFPNRGGWGVITGHLWCHRPQSITLNPPIIFRRRRGVSAY